MHPNCQKIFTDYCFKYFREGYKVLEVGPPLESRWYKKTIRKKKDCYWDTVDIKKNRSSSGKHHDVTFTGTQYCYPIKPNQYDVVFSCMVLEHVPMPWEWIKELKRVCKYDGYIIIIAPFRGDKHGSLDCWRALPQGMNALVGSVGLNIVESELLDLVKADYHIDTLMVARKE
ncbi:MAG: class I SAM-dependent methyltransferase [bacterium]|nr:class I SAM-dependent methyltransferase [bacterium]